MARARTASVDAERDGAEAGADDGGGAAGGAPGDRAGVVRVPRRPAHCTRTTDRAAWPASRNVSGTAQNREREKKKARDPEQQHSAYPWCGLMPLVPAPSSCMLALPARTAPQARSCATHAASASQRRAAPSHRVPPVVGYGRQSISSFTPTSTPSSADSGAPARTMSCCHVSQLTNEKNDCKSSSNQLLLSQPGPRRLLRPACSECASRRYRWKHGAGRRRTLGFFAAALRQAVTGGSEAPATATRPATFSDADSENSATHFLVRLLSPPYMWLLC